MEMNKTIINEENIEKFKELLAIKNNFLSYIGLENFINNIKNIIKECESFEFRSYNAENFIDKDRPVFILKIKEIPSEKDQEKYTDIITDKLQEEICSKANDIISDYIKDARDEINNLDDANLYLSSMFSILVGEKNENIIYLQLLV